MNANSKILIITSRADFGGGPEHIYQLSNNLINDFDFYFAAPQDFPYFDKYSKLVGKNNIIEIPHRKFLIKYLLALKKFVKENKIDLIHSHGKGAGIYSRILGLITKVKVIHTFHGLHIGEYNSVQRFLYISIEKILGLFTHTIINVSKSENELIAGFRIAKKSKLILIENGVVIPENKVDVKVFNQSPKTVISFTRFDYAKNTELVIPILVKLREKEKLLDFKFILLGSGPDEEKIKTLAYKNKISENLIFAGSVTETSPYLLNAFCYISTSRWEGMPLGVLEAFACGLPVIATNVAGNKDVIDNQINGLLYDVNNPNGAAELLINLSLNNALWDRISQNARARAEKFYSVQRMAAETKQLYFSVEGK